MAEVSVGDGGVRVHKVVCAVDCGIAINPDTIRAQMEGGIGFGLGAILAEELTLAGGEVRPGELRQLHAAAYRGDAARSRSTSCPRPSAPTGVGEPGVPPIGPAVANAIYAATGKRVRQLPIAKGMQA